MTPLPLPRRSRLLRSCAATLCLASAAAQTEPAAPSGPQYAIDLTIDADAHQYRGMSRVTVPATAADPLTDAVFVLYANAPCIGKAGAVPPLVIGAVRFAGEAVPWQADDSGLRVRLPAPQSQPFDLQIDFSATLPRIRTAAEKRATAEDDEPTEEDGETGEDDGKAGEDDGKAREDDGSHYGDYGLFGYGNDILSLGSFWYPQLAVRRDGKWASSGRPGPGDLLHAEAGDFTVTFGGLPERATVVATGTGDGRVFRATGVRDFAVLISNRFVSRQTVVKLGQKEVRITSYTKAANARQLTTTLEIASAALKIFSRRFGPYPFDELKVVEAPLGGGSGGMEYSGVASVGSPQYSMLTKAMSKIPWTKDSASKVHLRKAVRTWFECTLTHEIAHQWWALGVGNDSQRHPFVDEALTNWSMVYYFEDRYGRDRGREIRDSYLEAAFVQALGTDDCKDAPANLPTSGYRDIHQYGMVVYCKGGLFYQKLRELTGDEVFFEALRDYYRQFRGKLAGPADLRNTIIARAPAHRAAIDTLYGRWIEGAHGSEDIGEPAEEADAEGAAEPPAE